MKRYKRNRPCPKCGAHNTTVKYGKNIFTGKEALIKICEQCKYTWKESPLDSEEA